jgi:hypothetical protein
MSLSESQERWASFSFRKLTEQKFTGAIVLSMTV